MSDNVTRLCAPVPVAGLERDEIIRLCARERDLLAQVTVLESGLRRIVNLKNRTTRAAIREFAAEILREAVLLHLQQNAD